jgi:hypothetical protein
MTETNKNVERTLAALKAYDATRFQDPEFWKRAGRTNAEVLEAEAEYVAALKAVGVAFHEDGLSPNSLENDLRMDVRYIRYVATGHPGVGVIDVGAVDFGKFTGEIDGNGQPKWKFHLPETSGQRVNWLKDARDGKPLPEGVVLFGSIGPRIPIPADAVNWPESGLKDEEPRAGVTRLRR